MKRCKYQRQAAPTALLISLIFLFAGSASGFENQTCPQGDKPESMTASVPAAGPAESMMPDTLFSRELTPGVVHTRYLASGPNIMDVVAVDLSAPWLHFETTRPDELTRTTELSRDADRPGNRIVTAVNGDFFSFDTYWPISNQMVRGEFAHGVPVRNRYHFAVDYNGRPYMDALSFRGSLTLPDGTTFSIEGINRTASGAGILAYNRFFGDRTPPGNSILEMELVPEAPAERPGSDIDQPKGSDIDQPKDSGINRSTGTSIDQPAGSGIDGSTGSGIDQPMRVEALREDGGTSIPENGYIIRVQDPDKAAAMASALETGDRVIVRASFHTDHTGLVDVMGGGVRILDDGQPYSGTNEARHPRTFVAMDRDTTTVYLCTVDGRQMTSIGMSYREMADVLLKLGAWHAVNLDGGGSTTLAIRNEVANSPSDPGGERRVANALMLVSTAPEGEPERLNIIPEDFALYPHESQPVTITAFDRFQNPVPVPDDLTWALDPALGRLDDGLFTPGQTDTTGIITVQSGEISASAEVRIHHYTSLSAEPDELAMAPGERTDIVLYGHTADGTRRNITLDRVRFDQPDEALYLSHDGTVFATDHGSGLLDLDIGSAALSIPYQIRGDVVTEVIHDFEDDISGWATPAQTHRAQILGVDPNRSSLLPRNGTAVWTFVDDPDRDVDWDIRITRQLRQELGNQLYGSYVGVWVKTDHDIEIRVVIRDGDGQLESGPATRLVPGEWQLIQTRLADSRFDGYLNGDGLLTREGNQVNGFRITAGGMEDGAEVTLKMDRILASPFLIKDINSAD